MGFLSRIRNYFSGSKPKTTSVRTSYQGSALQKAVDTAQSSTKQSTPQSVAKANLVSSVTRSSGGGSSSPSPMDLVPTGSAPKIPTGEKPVIESSTTYVPPTTQQLRAKQMGTYYNTYPSGQGTPSFKPYNQSEMRQRDRIIERDEKIRTNILAGTMVVERSLGGIFNADLTDEQSKRVSGSGYFNPKTQFDVAKENVQADNTIREGIQISQTLDKLNRDYDSGKISWERYNASWNYYSNLPDYKTAINLPERRNVYQRISESNIASDQKAALTFAAAGTDALSYLVAPSRVLRGGTMVIQGTDTLNVATDKKQIQSGVLQIGMGSILVGSGFGGKTSATSSMFNRGGGSGVVSVARKGVTNWAVPGTFAYLGGKQIYKDTGDIGMGIAGGLGYMTGFKAPSINRGLWRTSEKLTEAGTKPNKYLFSNVPKLKNVNKNRFEKLSKYFEQFDAKVKKDLLNKKTRGEQVKYLKDIEKKITNPEAKSQFKDYVRMLEEQGFIKQIKVEITDGSIKSNILQSNTNVMTGRSSGSGISVSSKPDINAKDVGKTTFVTGNNNILSVTERTNIKNKSEGRNVSKTKQRTSQFMRTNQLSPSALSSAQKQSQIQKQKQKQRSILGLDMLQKQRTQQINKLLQIQRQRTKQPKPREFYKPFIPSTSASDFSTPAGISKEKLQLFKAYYKRRGKDTFLGAFETKLEAEKKLKEFLDVSISASGFVTKKGKKIKLGTGGQFRPSKSKKNPFTIVEKRKYRLSRRKELYDIGSAKKKKPLKLI